MGGKGCASSCTRAYRVYGSSCLQPGSDFFSNLQTWIHTIVIVGSILFYFVFALAFGATYRTHNPLSNPYRIMEKHMADPVFYLVCLLTTCVALLPRYVSVL